MQDLQYFSSSFSRPSSRQESRPHSRAPSDTSFTTAITANDRPESSHSTRSISRDLTREVDHIKSLIARSSQNASQSPSSPQGNSITAQVFRRRSASTSTVTHAQILQELDHLKRRIRQEQQQALNQLQQHSFQQQLGSSRLTEVDPDASESESEYADAFDEREVEIERAREELVHARLNGEQLLEAAEGKYDAVLGEKERLEGTLSDYRENLRQSDEHRNDLQQALRDARSSIRDLNDQIQHVRKEAQDLQHHAKALRTEKEEADRAHTGALSQLQNTLDSHSTRLAAQVKELEELQHRNLAVSREAQESATSTRELNAKLAATEASTAKAQKEHDTRKAELVSEINELKKVVESSQQEAAAHAKQIRELHQHRQDLATRTEELAGLTASKEAISRDLDSTRSRLKIVEARCATIVGESESKHSGSLEALQKSFSKDLQNLQDEYDRSTKQTARDHGQAIEQMGKAHRVALEQARQDTEQRLKDQDDKHQQVVELASQKHISDMDTLKLEHGKALAVVNGEHEQRLLDLKQSGADEAQNLVTVHNTNIKQVQEKAAEKLVSSLDAARRETDEQFVKMKDRHAKELEDLASSHKTALDAARSEAQTQLNEKHAQHDAEMSKLHATHDDEMAAVKGQHIETLRARDDEYKSLQNSHRQSMIELREYHDEQVASLKAQHQSEMQVKTNDTSKELADVVTEHEARFADLQSEQKANIAALTTALDQSKVEAESASRTAEETHRKSLEEAAQRAADSEARIADERESHQNAIASLRESLNAQIEEQRYLAEKHRSDLNASEAEREREVAALRSAHVEELQRVASEHDEHGAAVQAKISAELEQSREEAAGVNDKLRETEQTLQGQLRQLQADNTNRVIEMQQQHETALREAQESKRSELEKMQAVIHQSLEEEIVSVTSLHQKQMQKHQSSFDARLAEAKEHNSRALTERDTHWEKQVADLRAEHEQTSSANLRANDETLARKIQDLEGRHAAATTTALAAAQAEADERSAKAEAEHRSAMNAALDQMRESSNAEIKKLKKRHQDAVAEVRSIAQGQYESRLRELEARHQQALDSAEKGLEMAIATHEEERTKNRESRAEAHQAEILRLENEYQVKLADVEQKFDERAAAQVKERQAVFDSELASIQARLDASLTGQAEAERALAGVRRQSSEGDRRLYAVKSSLDEQLKALREEKDDLAAQLQRAQASFHELQAKLSEDDEEPTTPTQQDPTPEKDPSRRTSLHASDFQIARLEQELATAQLLAQKRLSEKSEMVRQNDFLIKELEVLLAQRSWKSASGTRKDASMQTDLLISEPKADSMAMRKIKAEQRSRPSTPLSPGQRQAREEIDTAWQSRSFEDYLRQAKSELSELGSVITANEALFAQKIQEHVGDLQKAKDLLAADYKEKLDRLGLEKDAMDRVITVKQQAAFAEERRKLVASYGADFDDSSARNALLTSLPVQRAKALRSAEQKLVSEFNRSLARRKSEIALRHAEEFQALTQDYDRNVAELLSDKRRLEGDLSVDPSRFENELNEMENISAQLEKDGRGIHSGNSSIKEAPAVGGLSADSRDDADERRSRPIHRRDTSHWTSTPRTAKSLPRSSSQPRAVPYPGSRHGTDATSQPQTPRSSHQTEKHPPIPQHSLIRGKNPTDVMSLPKLNAPGSSGGVEGRPAIPGRADGPTIPERRLAALPIVSSPDNSGSSVATRPIPASSQQDLSTTPAEFEKQKASTAVMASNQRSLEAHNTPQSSSKIPTPILNGVRDRSAIPASLSLRNQRASAPPTSPSIVPDDMHDAGPSSPNQPSSPNSSRKAGSGSLFRLKTTSKRLSSGLIYWKPPKQTHQMQAFET